MPIKQDRKDVGNSFSSEEQVSNIPEGEKKITPESETESTLESTREASQQPEQHEQEKLREAEKQVDTDEVSQKTPPPPPSKLMTDQDLVADLQSVMSLDKPKQVKVLVYLAFKKGVHHAFNVAKKLDDPYLLDEFHDTMVDELYDLLVKKKKIKTHK